MISLCRWRWLVASACFLALLSLLPLSMPPSLSYLTAQLPWHGFGSANGRSVATGGHHRHRGAPWRAEIGRWLSGCDKFASLVDVIENINDKECRNGCNSKGVCNWELGQCRCFHGFDGEGCTKQLQLECNLPSQPELPNGPWIVSICPPGHCDTTRAFCFCGEGTAYPNRQLIEHCGFHISLSSNGVMATNWAEVDGDVFSRNNSSHGWCNVNPKDAYESKVMYKEQCECRYDGSAGRFCEIPIESSCINQCSLHGYCRGGSCQCDSGWYGIDCSIPSALSPIIQWPKWLLPPSSSILVPNNSSIKAIVKKERPLIYVYDLPPEFNSHLLEGRHDRRLCVNRVYNDRNRTEWTASLYGAQIALYESILASPHRTLNGEEADFFYVPVLDSCIIARADDSPHFRMDKALHLRSFFNLEIYKKAYDHIVEHYPYWNRSSGRDHIWFFAWDEGACSAPKEIWNSMMLVHWGNTNSKHNYSTTAYWDDSWNTIPSERRGNHPCFDPSKDLVLPAWKLLNPALLRQKLWTRPLEERKILFYFVGNLGPAYKNGRPEDMYSMGIRQKVAKEFGSSPDKEGKLGRQHADDVIVSNVYTSRYQVELASSIFCGVFPGDGWSGRMEDSILHGCIPVVIQDGIFLPYENLLDYESFVVRIPEDDIPNMINILRRINMSQIVSMLKNVQSIRSRFLYSDSVMLEAKRQKHLHGKVEEWAIEYSKVKDDDVFTTFIQVLLYKLHNDPWRRENYKNLKEKKSGLPRTSSKEADN